MTTTSTLPAPSGVLARLRGAASALAATVPSRLRARDRVLDLPVHHVRLVRAVDDALADLQLPATAGTLVEVHGSSATIEQVDAELPDRTTLTLVGLWSDTRGDDGARYTRRTIARRLLVIDASDPRVRSALVRLAASGSCVTATVRFDLDGTHVRIADGDQLVLRAGT